MAAKLFSELGLSPELVKAVDHLGFEQASPIQAEAIPLLLRGEDVVGQSMTGSGKTAAFAAPAIEKVDVNQKAPQVLVLCPTRELAMQVSEETHKLALFKRGVHALPIYGGQSYDRQLYGLRQGAQIIIGTPGRIMDHMRRGTLRLNSLKMVVLDEVDVMLNMGFRDDIELILQATPKERQTVFFSATIPRPIQQLIEKYARNPQNVRIEQKALTVPTVEQEYYEVDRRFKVELLTRLIDLYDLRLGIIFCNTKRMVDELAEHLNAQGYSADRLHGDMTQAMRDRVMNKFRKSGLEFLVATDVAARGIDVDDVEVVFNYDLPYDGEDYVHRIGRTGRKGRSGRAISFASGREVFQIRNIERYTNVRIHRGKPPSAGDVEEARANAFLDKLRRTLKSGEFKRQDHLIERLLEEGFSSTDIASALLHHLQGADGASAAKVPREEDKYPKKEPHESKPDRHPSPVSLHEPNPRSADFQSAVSPTSQSAARSHVSVGFMAPIHAQKRNKTFPEPIAGQRKAASSPRPSAPPEPREKTAASRVHGRNAGSSNVESSHAFSGPAAEILPTQKPSPKPTPERTSNERHQPRISPRRELAEAGPAASPRHSRRTPDEQTRLFINAGQEMSIGPEDILAKILGETGLPRKVVGAIDIRERHLFVDVASEHVHSIVSKLNRTQLKGRRLKVKIA